MEACRPDAHKLRGYAEDPKGCRWPKLSSTADRRGSSEARQIRSVSSRGTSDLPWVRTDRGCGTPGTRKSILSDSGADGMSSHFRYGFGSFELHWHYIKFPNHS